ncbi:hypothetical protein CDV31_013137 [Fusarium ambrosium]|uniref:Uncharacterized protein n=1 Tax=Fusarium ambrosium TaxID=131363 RepID=A0A428T5C6_9HYPO|nr:hypothetical protein CDV31_013137 [Fusarium ambrosium]
MPLPQTGFFLQSGGAGDASRWAIITSLASLDDLVAADWLHFTVLGAGVTLPAARVALLLSVGWGVNAVAADASASALISVHLADAHQVHERGPIDATER